MCVCVGGGGGGGRELGQQFSNSSDAEGGCAMDFGLDGGGGGGTWSTIVETEGSGAKTGVVVTNTI